jgi:hypothetical protein
MNNVTQTNAKAATDHTTTGALTFTVRQDEKPYFLSTALTGGEAEVHFKTELRTVTIQDMRTITSDIEREGFELLHSPSQIQDFYETAVVDTDYNAEITEFLKNRFGASAVHVFDHTRRSDGEAGASNPDGKRGPAVRVHCDYTDRSGPQRAKDAMGDAEYERVIARGGRIVQINVWRPISNTPVQRSPLALATANSVPKDDLLATDQHFPDRIGEIYQLAHGEAHQWYYAPLMNRDEVILIKGWDTLEDGRARYTPHGAFQLPNQDQSAPPRESIETRTFLVIEAT